MTNIYTKLTATFKLGFTNIKMLGKIINIIENYTGCERSDTSRQKHIEKAGYGQ